jgi:uncharacterized paraquat-inducible protein A
MPSTDDDDDWDDPDEDGVSGDEDEPATVTCPYCQEQVYEDAVRCPRCENYISQEDAPPAQRPWWIVLGALAVLVIVALWILSNM